VQHSAGSLRSAAAPHRPAIVKKAPNPNDPDRKLSTSCRQ
jgi:hypothetical protein